MTVEDTIRAAVREEVRAALRELLQPVLDARRPEPSGPPYLTVKQAAEFAGGVRPETVRAWIKSGELPRHGKGRVLRVRREQLEDFLARGGAERETSELDLDARAREIVAGTVCKVRRTP